MRQDCYTIIRVDCRSDSLVCLFGGSAGSVVPPRCFASTADTRTVEGFRRQAFTRVLGPPADWQLPFGARPCRASYVQVRHRLQARRGALPRQGLFCCALWPWQMPPIPDCQNLLFSCGTGCRSSACCHAARRGTNFRSCAKCCLARSTQEWSLPKIVNRSVRHPNSLTRRPGTGLYAARWRSMLPL